MVRADLSYQDDIIRRSARFKPPLLHSNKLDMNYNHLLVDSTHADHSILNFLPQFTSNQVDSTTNLFNEVISTEVVIRPTEKTKECRPTQINIEEKWEQEKITPRKQEIQECVQTNIWGNCGSNIVPSMLEINEETIAIH